MPGFSRRLVVALLGAAVLAAALVLAPRRAPSDAPRDMAALVDRVRPLGLHVVMASANGNPAGGVYLCQAPWGRGALMMLPHDPDCVGQWSGVVLASRASQCLQDDDEQVGPFLLFGDPELLGRIRAALEP